MTEALGWLSFLVGWMTLLWIGGAIGEWIVPVLRRSKQVYKGNRKGRGPISK